jgi:hypothetical protein
VQSEDRATARDAVESLEHDSNCAIKLEDFGQSRVQAQPPGKRETEVLVFSVPGKLVARRLEDMRSRSAERRLSLERLTSSPDAHTGELAKYSARVPTRFGLRSHSSAAATALRPLRLICCRLRFTWKPSACWSSVQQSFQSRARKSDRATRVC